MKDCPHYLVRADLQGPIQSQRRDPVFAVSKMPTDGKPNRKGKYGSQRWYLTSLMCGYQIQNMNLPYLPPCSRWIRQDERTNWRASQQFQVVQAICISREPSPKLPKRLRVVNAGMGTFHCPSLAQLRLNGSPELSYLCDFPNCGFLQLHLGINIHLPDASETAIGPDAISTCSVPG